MFCAFLVAQFYFGLSGAYVVMHIRCSGGTEISVRASTPAGFTILFPLPYYQKKTK